MKLEQEIKKENTEGLPKLYRMFMDMVAGKTEDSFITYKDLYRLVGLSFRISKVNAKQILSELRDMGLISIHNRGISLEFKMGIRMKIQDDSVQADIDIKPKETKKERNKI